MDLVKQKIWAKVKEIFFSWVFCSNFWVSNSGMTSFILHYNVLLLLHLQAQLSLRKVWFISKSTLYVRQEDLGYIIYGCQFWHDQPLAIIIPTFLVEIYYTSYSYNCKMLLKLGQFRYDIKYHSKYQFFVQKIFRKGKILLKVWIWCIL